MKPLVIYHGQCKDGFCSAWVFHRKHGDNVEFHEGFYGQPPPDVTDREVTLVDFCYPRDVMQAIASRCAALTVLDHHKTAAAAMAGFGQWLREHHPALEVQVTFDMDRSGARLAWDYCFPTTTDAPWLVDYVQDRDLWRHALPDSKAINAYISTMEFSFDLWDETYDLFPHVKGMGPARLPAELGRAILSKTEQYVREVSKNAMRIQAGAWNVPIVNAPQVDVSELQHALCEGEPFSIAWWQRADGMYQYSLRSREGSTDVSLFAKAMGGGGHKHAAGFVAPKPPGPGNLGNLGLDVAPGQVTTAVLTPPWVG